MQISLTDDFIKRMRVELRRARSREIGGLLFAEQLSPGAFRLAGFTVDSMSGSDAQFNREPNVHFKLLKSFVDNAGGDYSRFNYLGEWHSHPSFSVNPSITDIDTMIDLVNGRGSSIPFALLLIVRLRFWFLLDASATIFSRGKEPKRTRLGTVRWI
jgi:hypothetical protein